MESGGLLRFIRFYSFYLAFSSSGYIEWYLTMNSLTLREQSSLGIAFGLILSLLLSFLLFSGSNEALLLILWGIIAVAFSVIFAYSFVFQSTPSHSEIRDSFHSSSGMDSFSPRIIPPSKMRKKTQIEGQCSQCGSPTLLGFTCSYCGRYFCPDHRLPEKHECTGLYHK
ncbi:hypothetical protein CEE45_00350 [Candidatus Heimdallarchaeota archaeon B3_Heim]|nr:MAG: hypothetical protein CEE45_00350 [Candidatus Heimdallarchaeota archaeon B3_Heim]